MTQVEPPQVEQSDMVTPGLIQRHPWYGPEPATTQDILGLAGQLIADPANYSRGGVMRDADGQPCDFDRACQWDAHGAIRQVATSLGLTYRDRRVREAVRSLARVAYQSGAKNITHAADRMANCWDRTGTGLFVGALRLTDHAQCDQCGGVFDDVYTCTSCYRVAVCGECVTFEDSVPFYDGEESVCEKCANDYHKDSWTRFDRLAEIFGKRVAEWMAEEWERREEEKYKHLFQCTACGKWTFDDWHRYSATGGFWWCGCVQSQTKHDLDRETKLNPATGRPYGDQKEPRW